MENDELNGNSGTEQRVIEALDESLEGLSNQARHRLYLARQQALRHAERKVRFNNPLRHRFYWHPTWKPLVPAAAMAIFVGVFFLVKPQIPVPEMDAGWEADSELLFGEDDLELYEDLEFYAWLAEVETG